MIPSEPPRYPFRQGVIACTGIFIVISVLAFSSFNLEVLLALGSFGSTSVLLFAFPESHFAQPRSIVGGHVISSAVGLLALFVFGKVWRTLGLTVALSADLMMLTRTVHPPAGSNPVIVFLIAPHWHFLFFPTLFGAMTMVLAGLIYHHSCRRPYPLYWTGKEAKLSPISDDGDLSSNRHVWPV